MKVGLTSYRLIVQVGGVVLRRGTGWLARQDRVVTSLHVVGNRRLGRWLHEDQEDTTYELQTEASAESVKLEPLFFDSEADLAVLRPIEAVTSFTVLELAQQQPALFDRWRGKGFPEFHDGHFTLSGEIKEWNSSDPRRTLELLVKEGVNVPWQGISGMPILHGGTNAVIGVIHEMTDDTSTGWAASVDSLRQILGQDSSSHIDVLLGHNSKDNQEAATVTDELRRRGLSVWRPSNGAPDSFSDGTVEKVIHRTRTAVVLIGEHWPGCNLTPSLSLLRREHLERIIRVIAVILPGGPRPEDLPDFLQRTHPVDLRRGLLADGLDELERSIRGTRILIAHQDEDFSTQINEDLSGSGFDIHWVVRPGRVLSSARRLSPDILVLDFAFDRTERLSQVIDQLRGLKNPCRVVLSVWGERYRNYASDLKAPSFDYKNPQDFSIALRKLFTNDIGRHAGS